MVNLIDFGRLGLTIFLSCNTSSYAPGTDISLLIIEIKGVDSTPLGVRTISLPLVLVHVGSLFAVISMP
jgi:hypothetical protein